MREDQDISKPWFLRLGPSSLAGWLGWLWRPTIGRVVLAVAAANKRRGCKIFICNFLCVQNGCESVCGLKFPLFFPYSIRCFSVSILCSIGKSFGIDSTYKVFIRNCSWFFHFSNDEYFSSISWAIVYWKLVNFSLTHHVRLSVGRSVCRSVIITLKDGRHLHYHAPIGALVTRWNPVTQPMS